MAKVDDPFSGGRTYWPPQPAAGRHAQDPHQSSATGMQAIPPRASPWGCGTKAGGHHHDTPEEPPVVVCSLGDASITEGEVAGPSRWPCWKKLPIIYLVQDNGGTSAPAPEIPRGRCPECTPKASRAWRSRSIDGADFATCWSTLRQVVGTVRKERRPFLVHAKGALLNHHTSGVRMGVLPQRRRPGRAPQARSLPALLPVTTLLDQGFKQEGLKEVEKEGHRLVRPTSAKTHNAADPTPEDLQPRTCSPPHPDRREAGDRAPKDREPTVMVDCALFAIRRTDAGGPAGAAVRAGRGRTAGRGVPRAATLARDFGDHRVFNTPIREAFIVGSTVGMRRRRATKPMRGGAVRRLHLAGGSTSSSPKWPAAAT